MEFLGKYFAQIRAHLAGLTASQRIALGLCVVLVVVGVVALMQWSGRVERVPLLAQSLSADEQSRILAQLQAANADYEMQGDRILVPRADRVKLYASLVQARALPTHTNISFSALMEENNPFLARDDARWRKERALEGELSNVLMHFDGLTDAKVFITVPQRRTMGGEAGKASASVYVHSRPGASLDKGMVASIAEFVSGAVEGLTPDGVKIVDAASGRSFHRPSAEDAMPFDVLDLRRQREEHYAAKIMEHLAYISGVLVGVHADLDLDRKQVSETKLGKPVTSTEESITSNTTRGGGAAGPGVQPNIAKAVAGGGTSESTSKEETKTSFDGRRDEMVTHTTTIPGDIRKLTASVNVPRSYFAGIFKQRGGSTAEPKDADLDPIIKSETIKIRTQIRPLIAASDDNQVEVDWYYDSVAAAAPTGGPAGSGPTGAAQAGMDMGAMAKQYGPQAGLGLLALFALFSVMRMARRAGAAIAPPQTPSRGEKSVGGRKASAATSDGQIDTLPGGEALAGEALSTQAVLEGHEVGEDEVRIRHIIHQLGTMVKEDPGTAVGLVEQWVTGHR